MAVFNPKTPVLDPRPLLTTLISRINFVLLLYQMKLRIFEMGFHPSYPNMRNGEIWNWGDMREGCKPNKGKEGAAVSPLWPPASALTHMTISPNMKLINTKMKSRNPNKKSRNMKSRNMKSRERGVSACGPTRARRQAWAAVSPLWPPAYSLTHVSSSSNMKSRLWN